MTQRLAILGAGGHGKVVAEAAESSGWDEIVFFDESWPGRRSNGTWPINGDMDTLLESLSQFDGVTVAIGENRVRLHRSQMLLEKEAPLATLVHGGAIVSPRATLSPGSVVFAGAVINVGTRLGLAGIINTGATIDHDCTLDDGVHVSPGAHLAGGVVVGCRSWIGIGATVRHNIKIGSDVTIGAGACVISNIADRVTAVGVPAKVTQGDAPC